MNEAKRKIISIGRVVILALISLIIGLMIYRWNAQTLTGNAVPMPFGCGISFVRTGSMDPTLSVNDLVIVKEADNYKVGDIVVYQDENMPVIHRIISIDGEKVITQGDNNNKPDDPISIENIKGKMVVHIPFLGVVAIFLKTPVGTMLLIIVAIVLFELPHHRERKKAIDEQEKIKEEIKRLKGEE